MSAGSAIVELGGRPVTVAQICDIAAGRARVALSTRPCLRAQRIEQSRASLDRQLAAGRTIYGVTTGVGESCETPVPAALSGRARAATCCASTAAGRARRSPTRRAGRGGGAARRRWRAATPACGLVVLERLVRAARPPRPAAHPVGGLGRRERRSDAAVLRRGGAHRRARASRSAARVMPAAEALSAAGLEPLALRPKESAGAHERHERDDRHRLPRRSARAPHCARLAAALTAMAVDVLRGNSSHFDERIFEAKPHPGQRPCARWIREDLGACRGASRQPRGRAPPGPLLDPLRAARHRRAARRARGLRAAARDRAQQRQRQPHRRRRARRDPARRQLLRRPRRLRRWTG